MDIHADNHSLCGDGFKHKRSYSRLKPVHELQRKEG
jgi:hypothetical protein